MHRALLPLLLLIGACTTGPPPWSVDEPAEPGPYELLDPVSRGQLREVVTLFEGGRLAEASAKIAELDRWWGKDVYVAIWKQEIELAAGIAAAPGEEGVGAEGAPPRKQLREHYRRRAEEDPDPLKWVLAARVEDDAHAARLLLGRALELNPSFSWAYYGLAHTYARAGEIPDALVALRIAFENDPDNLPALRLYGWCAAQSGERDRAVAALETWLERAGQDLLATSSTRAEVTLDLALIHLAAGRPARAEALIEELAPESVDEIRRLAARAAAEQEQGDDRSALRTSEAALALDPDALLPAVQRALILELWLEDIEGARVAWRRVLELSARQGDLAGEVQRFRAELHLARLPRPAGIQEMAR